MKAGGEKRRELRDQILKLLRAPKYQPLDTVGISRELGLSSDARAGLRALLREMEEQGAIARIRKDRYVLPSVADLVTGEIQVHQTGGAHVLSTQKGQPDLYIPAEHTWTALHGDTVVARVSHEGVHQRSQRREGRVIRILKRANPTIVGVLQRSQKFFYVIPDSPKLVHNIYVDPSRPVAAVGDGTRQPQVGDKVVVRLDEWETRHVNPEGEIIEVLGRASDPGVDIISIVRKFRLPEVFPESVLGEAEGFTETVTERELAEREDLREQLIVTIDPDDAKDFDDAIFVERQEDGWSLGVHIADVSHYVRPGTALDREAFARGNSVYLADRVIPMLPEALSNGICSLKPGVERLTRSAFIEFSRDGRVRKVRFARTVIRSQARLTYKEAFAILGKPPQSPLAERLHTAWELASLLRKNRFSAGSLDLDFPEIKVWLDDTGKPVRLERVEYDISHQLIEEFMLAANEAVAAETKRRLAPSIYRIHENPDDEKLVEYRELVRSYGIQAGDLTNRRELVRLLASLRDRPEQYALKIGLLKSLKRAAYSVDPLGHYGLAKVNYTHFTSPIRRYADLVVHRVLDAIGGGKRQSANRVSAADLTSVAEHISSTERVAAEAEKESVKLKKIEYFQAQIDRRTPEVYESVVVDVRSYGLLVELPQFLLTGLIHVSALRDDFYVFDSVKLSFTGRSTRTTYRIGQRVNVMVSKVDVYKQQVDFHPVEKETAPRRRRGRG